MKNVLNHFVCVILIVFVSLSVGKPASAKSKDPLVKKRVRQGLDWVASQQSRAGHWTANGRYPTAMTSLAGLALLCEGSTATQGRYSENIRSTIDYLVERSRPNGLIGDPNRDDRYTYGHGFAMLFLSQVLGEEEDEDRRKTLIDVLTRAVIFTGQAQTNDGGWGYVSAKDGNQFDEGSTTITQVQGLRGCRNAGIPVPKEILEKAITYIRKCTGDDGGVKYSLRGGGGRPAITAAAIACLFNAGEYDDKYVPKMMAYCKKNIGNTTNTSFGHWHYAHFYYSQVQYRKDDSTWKNYRNSIYRKLTREAKEVKIGEQIGVYWDQGYIGPIYTTSFNLIILQLENGYIPIYQR